MMLYFVIFFFFQAEDGIRDYKVTGVQTCALPICTMFAQMHNARRFFETHHGRNSPLIVIEQFVRVHGLPDPAQVKQLSQEVALPEATVRGAISYYSDLHQNSEAV